MAERVRTALLAMCTVVLTCFASSRPAQAACPTVNLKLASAQASLREAEPAHDNTVADFERRLGLVASAYRDADAAETIRSTTLGGCADIQQVYSVMMTRTWADLVFAYLKPSLEFYMADPSCKFISQLHTKTMLLEADETMNRSLISWYPIDDGVTAIRDHITRLVDKAAAYSNLPLPTSETAEDVAKRDKFRWDVGKSRAPMDCGAALSAAEPNVPKPLISAIFTPAT